MKTIVATAAAARHATEAFIVGHFEGSPSPAGAAYDLDEAAGRLLSHIIETGDFTGKRGESTLAYTRGAIPGKRIVMAGLGKRADLSPDVLRTAFAGAARKIRDAGIREFSLSLDIGDESIPLEQRAAAVTEGIMLGLYRFTAYRTSNPDPADINAMTIVERGGPSARTVRTVLRETRTICEAVILARDLVSSPSNEMTPAILAAEARRIGRSGQLSVKVIERAAMKRMGMNALLGVARGSAQPPKLIVMEYRGADRARQPIVIAGKGITFDSGGISLKPSDSMERMKDDMAGGAVVLATLKAAAALAFPLNIVGLVPAAENLPDGEACKPGDVLRSLSGQTIEVTNTDAEGRLILADALAYARRFNPAAIIDIATLTGACTIALGNAVTGMLGNDEPLKNAVRRAAESTGEAVWELPLWEEYEELLKSDVADMKNVGTRAAGTITAALFLKKFVGDTPWVHLDIAGTAFTSKDKGYLPKGASGIGVRLLTEFLKMQARGDHEQDT